VTPTARARLTDIALAAAFAGSAAWLFAEGETRDGSLPFFLAWIVVHVLFGFASGSLSALFIAVAAPPLFVAAGSADWLDALFVELFYGVAFVFTGVVLRRVWELRRARPEDG
jgi:cytochrome c oxidase assembly factor CtaG